MYWKMEILSNSYLHEVDIFCLNAKTNGLLRSTEEPNYFLDSQKYMPIFTSPQLFDLIPFIG